MYASNPHPKEIMMSIGSDWKAKLDVSERMGQERKTAEMLLHCQVEAEKIIAGLPAAIDRAAREGKGTINILDRDLGFSGVAGNDVDQLMESVDRMRNHTTRDLSINDLAGTARILFEWCSHNGLKCYVQRTGKVPGDGDSYGLFAHPCELTDR